MKSPLENLDQAYAEKFGDNAQRSVIAKLIQAEEQGLAGSEASNRAAAEGRGIGGSGAAGNFIKDLGKGALQLSVLETLGLGNRILPTTGLGTADKDYYGWSIGDKFEARDLLPNFFKEAFMSNEYKGDMVIPYDEYINNPRL